MHIFSFHLIVKVIQAMASHIFRNDESTVFTAELVQAQINDRYTFHGSIIVMFVPGSLLAFVFFQ